MTDSGILCDPVQGQTQLLQIQQLEKTMTTDKQITRFQPMHGGRTYRAEMVLFDGYKRRQWCVVERECNGEENHISVAHGRKSEALFAANIWPQIEQKRQRDIASLQNHPLGAALLSTSSEVRQTLIQLLTAVERLQVG